MSRLGKLPITVPTGTKVSINNLDLKIEGPKGSLSKSFKGNLDIKLENSEILISLKENVQITKFDKAMFGTARSIISNMVYGVNNNFTIELSVVGVGYRVSQIDGGINFNYGYSHSIKFLVKTPHINNVKITTPKQDSIIIQSIDKELAGLYASEILALRKFNVYKGKGVSIKSVKMLSKKRKTKK